MSQFYVTPQRLSKYSLECETFNRKLNVLQERLSLAKKQRAFYDHNGSLHRKLASFSINIDNDCCQLQKSQTVITEIARRYTNCELMIHHIDGIHNGGNVCVATSVSSGLSSYGVSSWVDSIAKTYKNFKSGYETVESIFSGNYVLASGSIGGAGGTTLFEGSANNFEYAVYQDQYKWDADYSITASTLSVAFGGAYTAYSTTANYESLFGTTAVKVEAGHLEASVEGEMDLKSGDLYVSGDLGYYAGKIEVSQTGSICGLDVVGGASVYAGIEAHFDAGFKDGVFSLDAGAALGIGGGISLSVDVLPIFNIGKKVMFSLFD